MAPLAPFLVASLIQLGTLDMNVGARVDGVTTKTFDAEEQRDQPRTAVTLVPSVAGLVEDSNLRLTLSYEPRLWNSDVDYQRSPWVLQSHTGTARIETHHDAAWRAEAFATGTRGQLDPVGAAIRAPPAGQAGTGTGTAETPGVVATTGPTRYEELTTGVAGATPLDERTNLSGGARYRVTRSLGSDALTYPTQRSVAGDATASYLVTELDSLSVTGSGLLTVTDREDGQTARGGVISALGSWRRRFTPFVTGWAGAGALWLYDSLHGMDTRLGYEFQPSAVVGFLRGGEELSTTVDGEARLTATVDRFDGRPHPWVDVRLGVAHRSSERLAFDCSASSGFRTDGRSTVASAQARLTYLLAQHLSLETGITGRSQYETRADRPTFYEVGAFVALAWRLDRIFGSSPDPARPGGPM